ncbi:PepSY domain-containing protein [Breoghania sp. L-A4]|uniref:PepSY domain-containing protein n=1 Tax=Breoghania sp. L-A4 TaxID=2304600 RepID=UPI0019678856|nr:PepSY domain-containing protein [Breoghania sp. L-A4]
MRQVSYAVALSLALTGTAAAQCLSGGEARQAVASGQAQPLGAISAGIQGKIVRADLCQSGGRLVYQLSVLSGSQVRRVTVDARSGAVLR